MIAKVPLKAKALLPFSSIPGPRPLPLIGNVWRYLPVVGQYKPNTLFENGLYNRDRYGKLVREKITADLTILHLFDPDDIEAYFRSDTKMPHRRSHRALLKYRRSKPELYRDGGLFAENGPTWFKKRMQFQSKLMSRSGVASNLCKLDQVARQAVQGLELELHTNQTNVVKSLEVHIYRWAVASALSIFLNVDPEIMSNKQLDQIVDQLHKSLEGLTGTELKSTKWLDKPTKCPFYRDLAEAESFLYNFVAGELQKSINTGRIEEGTYLNQWLLKDKLDKLDIITFCTDAIMAGLHTSSYTVIFLLYYLARNPQYQAKIRHSLRDNSVSDNKLHIDDLDKVIILRDCYKESLRLRPVSIGSGRLASTDAVRVKNYQVARGTMVIAHNQIISRDESIYEEADKFKPERWAEYRARTRQERPSPFAMLPFGFGPRVCIGQHLSSVQIRVLTARLLQRFNISMPDEIETETQMVHVLKGNIKAELRKIIC